VFISEYWSKLNGIPISTNPFAIDLGMDRAFVSNIENGKTNPTLATITKLAKALGVSVAELMK